jgi:hypothetical protein
LFDARRTGKLLAGHELRWPDGQAFYVVLRRGTGGVLADLRRTLCQRENRGREAGTGTTDV